MSTRFLGIAGRGRGYFICTGDIVCTWCIGHLLEQAEPHVYDPRFRQYWEAYHRLMGRRGISVEAAKSAVRRSNTTIAALMVHLGDADAMLCGLVGRFDNHLEHVHDVIGVRNVIGEMTRLTGPTLDLIMCTFGILLVLLGLRAVVAVVGA